MNTFCEDVLAHKFSLDCVSEGLDLLFHSPLIPVGGMYYYFFMHMDQLANAHGCYRRILRPTHRTNLIQRFNSQTGTPSVPELFHARFCSRNTVLGADPTFLPVNRKLLRVEEASVSSATYED